MIELLQDTIARAAAADPSKTAFRCGKHSIDYASLDRQSSQLAALLCEHSVQPGDRVGVYMPRCIEASVAIYGILKAGAVMVPIDPHLPVEAISHLVDDCGIRCLLTTPKLDEQILSLATSNCGIETVIGTGVGTSANASQHSCRFLDWTAFDTIEPLASDALRVAPADPAYIMYSSGSTGKSKGITHSHSSGLAYARLSTETYGVTEQDVIANHSPLNFDMSTFGYFSSCYAGATTVIVPEAYTKVPVSLARLIESEQITIWYSVPLALIQLLLRAPLAELDLSRLRWIKYGGEPFPPKHLRALMRFMPNARFSNVYGPAEVNQCTYYHVPLEFAEEDSQSAIPIGRVWNESKGLMIDEDDRVIPESGSADEGELVVHSPTRMIGYWNSPERNAVAFFRDPDSGDLYYRTGDLVRRSADGNLTFVGRKDRQIKIRGYRVELDDVENAISRHPDVQEVGVFCTGAANEKEIRAAVILGGAGELTESELRNFLAGRISPYAVPSHFELVGQLPRTTSGKIDRNRLTAQAQTQYQS